MTKIVQKFLLVIAAAVLCLAPSALADQVSMAFTGTTTPTSLTINDSVLGTVTGVIDPYKGTVNGQSVLMFCVDPDHAINYGDTWTANRSYPGGDLSKTYQVMDYNHLSNSAANTLYEEMAGLALLLEGTTDTTKRQEIQGAIWQLADSGLTFPNPPIAGFQSAVTAYETWAASNPLTSGFEILSDVNNCKQEYIVFTPEPATVLLLGLGLGGLLWLKRRQGLSSVA